MKLQKQAADPENTSASFITSSHLIPPPRLRTSQPRPAPVGPGRAHQTRLTRPCPGPTGPSTETLTLRQRRPGSDGKKRISPLGADPDVRMKTQRWTLQRLLVEQTRSRLLAVVLLDAASSQLQLQVAVMSL
ncbi:uncharacterized protein V6R79_005088 [Siganus canaliculatus]